MQIALCAPVNLHAIALHLGKDLDGIPAGLGSTATTPLVCELIDRGHEVTLYTLSHDVDRPHRFEWGPLRARVGLERRKHCTRSFYNVEINYLRQAIRDESPRFVNAHWTYEFALGALRASVPTLVTIHDLPWRVLRYFRDVHRTVRLAMAYEVALRCKDYTAVSADAALHFQRYLRPGARIEVIPNSCDERQFPIPYIGPRTGSITFATVLQGWTRRKNPKPALFAFQKLKKNWPEARLLMAGSGYEAGGEAQQWAELNGLIDGVEFLGNLPHLQLIETLNREVDILVHPSLDEAFSVTILEAMATAKPVIAGQNTAGVKELLGETGIAVNVSNPDTLARAMHMLASDEQLRIQLSRSTRERAFLNFGVRSVVDKYEAAYQRFLQTRR